MTTRNLKKQNIVQLILILLILVFVNILSGFVFSRLDMTGENRYSLSPSSKKLASGLKDVVYFRIYLDGDLPPGFKRLRNSIKEILDEFRVYAGDNIEYEFVGPTSSPDENERMNLYKQLAQKGLLPTNLEEKDKAGQSQKIIFPGAIVNYKSFEMPLQLLKSRIGSSSEQMLNSSIEGLEYEISSTLRKLSTQVNTQIAFIQGQQELPTIKVSEAARALSEDYKVDTLEINNQLNALKDYKAIIIAKPDTAFDEKDKFIIDQYIMHGGRVLWLLDKMQMDMDSLSAISTTVVLPKELNLDDMLFKYGVRINTDLVMDLQAAPIPIVTGYVGNQPKQEIFPWYYFPLLNSESKHPIVHNLNAIKGEFVSSIDTVEADSVTKTVLLSTSRLSKLQFSPARVSLNILQEKPDPKLYTKKYIPVAVLLEGKFTSNYLNRIPDQLSNSPEINFKPLSAPTKMIVVSDGDIIANFVSKKGAVYPLGYDRITRQTYGNRNFILNCIDYLCDDSGVLELRGKEFRLRMLDPEKTKDAGLIRWVNVLSPLIAVLLFGLLFTYLRRKKFGH